MHVLVTGATGFLGRHTVPVLQAAYPQGKVSAVSSTDYNLMSLEAAHAMIAEVKPDVIVHYAAYSGGIGANRTYPADFYFRNTLLTANVFQAAAEAKVGKVVYTMGGCSYPATATSPIDETQLWNGYPQKESAGYSFHSENDGYGRFEKLPRTVRPELDCADPGQYVRRVRQFHPPGQPRRPSLRPAVL
jgi:GDP-L-fucose synthase